MESLDEKKLDNQLLFDFWYSIQQLCIAIIALCRACSQATLVIIRLVFFIAEYIAPFTKVLFAVLSSSTRLLFFASWRMYAASSIKMRLLICSLICLGSVAIYLLKSGIIARLAKKFRRMKRRGYRSIKKCSITFHNRTKGILLIITEVLSTLFPIVAIFLPMRLYFSRLVFRRFFNWGTFVLPVWYSILCITQYYKLNGSSINYPTNVMESTPRSTACVKNRNAVYPIKLEQDTDENNLLQQDNFSNTSLRYISFITSFIGISNHSETALPLSIEQQTVEDSIAGWLDYWIAATLFDLLFKIPVLIGRVSVRGKSLGVQFGMFGHVDEILQSSSYTAISYIRPSYNFPYSFSGTLAIALGQGFCFFHDFCYAVLLVFVVTRKQRHLRTARQCLVSVLENCIFHLFGIRMMLNITNDDLNPPLIVTPSSSSQRRLQSSNESNVIGLIPTIWGSLLRTRRPSTILFGLDILTHVPQICLLMAPPFSLPLFVNIVGLLYPAFSSIRALGKSDLHNQLYWLLYFTLKTCYELLFMQWLRNTRLWLCLPLVSHLELILIIALQVLCTKHYFIIQLFYSKISINHIQDLPIVIKEEQDIIQEPSINNQLSQKHLNHLSNHSNTTVSMGQHFPKLGHSVQDIISSQIHQKHSTSSSSSSTNNTPIKNCFEPVQNNNIPRQIYTTASSIGLPQTHSTISDTPCNQLESTVSCQSTVKSSRRSTPLTRRRRSISNSCSFETMTPDNINDTVSSPLNTTHNKTKELIIQNTDKKNVITTTGGTTSYTLRPTNSRLSANATSRLSTLSSDNVKTKLLKSKRVKKNIDNTTL